MSLVATESAKTTTFAIAFLPLIARAVIVTSPGAFAVTVPSFISAMFLLLLFHTTLFFTSFLLGVILALKLIVSPTLITAVFFF